MCGVFGVFGINISSDLSNLMLKSLSHRGPDDFGIFKDNENKILLGHTRLSILDTSYKGHQPMINDEENIVIIFK